MRIFEWSLLGLSIIQATHAKYPEDRSTPLKVITFGSCNHQDRAQPMWPIIQEQDPSLWIWMGDNIYGDSRSIPVLTKKFQKQFDHPGYKLFRQSVPIIGTWDDHDYGENNAGKEYPTKVATQELLLNFLQEPKNSPRRRQHGIYASYTFGKGDKQTKIILLDGRYHMEHPGAGADNLGKQQWLWLQNELKTSQATINLIVSGIQILPTDHLYEKWANFPKSRQLLISMIQKYDLPGVILLSGDRHIHEVNIIKPEGFYPITEITSSGLTHSWEAFKAKENDTRYGAAYTGLAFGKITFDWKNKQLLIQIINVENKPVTEILYQFNDLKSTQKK